MDNNKTITRNFNQLRSFDIKQFLITVLLIIISADIAILLNISILRQILGVILLTILPGVLIVLILRLNKLSLVEKGVLSVGLSISFLMLFGLLVNNLSLSFGYETPLATIPLLISFNIAFIVLAIIGYKISKDTIFSFPNLNLTTSEKAFLIVPVLFPALSMFGMHVMNTTDNNILLMFLLFLIPIYVAFVCFFNHKFPNRLYPIVIFLISISLLLLWPLRSNHIMGSDIHFEYMIFQTTTNNLHWSTLGHTLLDACPSISLLPAIYQSILNTSPEYLYKILYSVLYSIAPLAIYIISKKYVGELYGFLASCFYMFQSNFLLAGYTPRTSIALLFFALAMMTLFNDRIDPLKKRILFITFIFSCIISHYSTAYIFFFIMFGAFIGIEILLKKYTFKKVISLTLVVLFFAMIFFWYSQVTEVPFNASLSYFERALSNLNMFFIEESRSTDVQALFGEDITEKGIPHRVEFVFTWLTFALIGVGIITLISRYKEMSFPDLNFKKHDFLTKKFEIEYFLIALSCVGLLVLVVVVPHLSIGYGLGRLYAVATTILSVFFVIGGIVLSRHLNQLIAVFRGKALKKNTSEVRACLIILLVLIPYFLCSSGFMYNMFGTPRSVLLNSEGDQYTMYIHDTEVISAKWLTLHASENATVYTDFGGESRLNLGYYGEDGSRKMPEVSIDFFKRNKTVHDGYVYLRYRAVVDGKVMVGRNLFDNVTNYMHLLNNESKIYNNGYSQIFKSHD